MKTTVFYDGQCPLCLIEMKKIRQLDLLYQIQLIDLHQQKLMASYPEIDLQAAMAILHGYDQSGKLLKGLDVTAHVWKQLGHHRWIQCLRWPLIRFFADLAYQGFAKHRYRLSRLFLGRNCSCEKPKL